MTHELVVPNGFVPVNGDVALTDDGLCFVYDELSNEYIGPHDWDYAQKLSDHLLAGK